jgi:DNA polymerase III alpha subunit
MGLTIEHEADGALSLRMGLGYAKGLRCQSAETVVAARSQDGHFRSAEDLSLRVPLLNRKELTLMARIGALNKLDGIEHRRMLCGRWNAPENWKAHCSGRIATGSGKPPMCCS